jgi:hypothetical protein
MSTNINITVQHQMLIERSKRQQKNARTGRLTEEVIKTDAEKNRDRLIREAAEPKVSALFSAPNRPIDTETAPYIRPNRPAATRIPDNAFLVVTNLNASGDDIFNDFLVYLRTQSGATSLLNGVLEFEKFDFRNKTYLFLPRGKRVADFRRSVPFSYIDTILDILFTPVPEGIPRPVNYVEPTYTLSPFRPDRGTAYTITLERSGGGVGNSPSGTLNYGGLMAGYLNSPTFYYDRWFTLPSEYPTVSNVQWGQTNPAIVYPSDYPG